MPAHRCTRSGIDVCGKTVILGRHVGPRRVLGEIRADIRTSTLSDKMGPSSPGFGPVAGVRRARGVRLAAFGFGLAVLALSDTGRRLGVSDIGVHRPTSCGSSAPSLSVGRYPVMAHLAASKLLKSSPPPRESCIAAAALRVSDAEQYAPPMSPRSQRLGPPIDLT